MLKNKEVRSHLTVAFIYFLIVSFLRFKLDWNIFGLWLGALVGTFFLDIDHLVFWFITHPERSDSLEARKILECKQLKTKEKTKQLFNLLKGAHNSHNRLIFHSLIGQVLLFILAIYILTSSGSLFGSSFIMAINLHLLKDEWTDYRRDKNHLADWLFWQIREPKAKLYLNEYLIAATLLFLIFTGLMLR